MWKLIGCCSFLCVKKGMFYYAGRNEIFFFFLVHVYAHVGLCFIGSVHEHSVGLGWLHVLQTVPSAAGCDGVSHPRGGLCSYVLKGRV